MEKHGIGLAQLYFIIMVITAQGLIVLNIKGHCIECLPSYRGSYCDLRLLSCPNLVLPKLHLSSNRNLDFDTSLNVDDDLLDDLGRGIETIISLAKFLQYVRSNHLLNQTLVDSHLESIPGLGSFTAGSFSGSDLESRGWEADRTLNTEILGLGTLDEFLADLLEGLDLSAGQGDSDFVGFLSQIQSVRARKLAGWKLTGPSPNSLSGFFW